MDISKLIELDKQLLLKLNGSDSLFLDGFMWFATTTYIWIPTALALLFILYKNNDLKTFFFTIVAIALVITMADQIASSVCKPLFQRWRPTHDPEIMNLVDVVKGYRGGRFGFISSHAANTFGLTTFIYLLTRKKSILFIMLTWAGISSYSRIYLGVHYPGDIIAGILVGCLCGLFIYYIYKKVLAYYFKSQYVSQLSSHKYQSKEVLILFFTFTLTLIFISILSLMFSNTF